VKRSRILKKEKGILAIPDNKKGRKLSPEEEEIVKDFYLKDENFRVLPGMNDFVSVRIYPGEKKSKVQKQLPCIFAGWTHRKDIYVGNRQG
jgi:hypothetical protein